MNTYNETLQENNNILDSLIEVAKKLPDAITDAVRTSEQELSEDQKTQARTNIGAASAEVVDGLSKEIADLLPKNQGEANVGKILVVGTDGNLTLNDMPEDENKVNMFHAVLDPATTQYVKDSGDFTYADVLAVENCKIEAVYGNIKIIFNKEVVRNIEPDPVTGRYVEFSALLRNGITTVKVFLFVYDPKNLPTDAANAEILKNWGDSQYCGIEVQRIVIGDFLDNDIATGRYNTINSPSTKAVGDYVDGQCGVVLDYMQTTFANNIMALCSDRFGPHIIYDNPTGFEANDKDVGAWQLTGLNLTPYKKLKFYIRSGGDSDSNWSPSHIVELHLDDRARGSNGHFTAGHTAVCPNSTGRFHNVIVSVSADKTALAFNRSNRYSASTSATSIEGRRCYLIEGYLT